MGISGKKSVDSEAMTVKELRKLFHTALLKMRRMGIAWKLLRNSG